MDDWEYGGYTGYKAGDEHFRFAFPLTAATKTEPQRTVYLSSSRGHAAALSKSDATQVDFGVYLDGGWKYQLEPLKSEIVTSKDVTLPAKVRKVWDGYKPQPLKGVYLPWRDMQAPMMSQLTELVKWINEMIDEGLKVEIACIGGHGRTGTLATALLMSRHPTLGAGDAIAFVRQVYCKQAVESMAQVNILYDITGETHPPPPKVKTYKPPMKNTGTSSAPPREKQGLDLDVIRRYYYTDPANRLALFWVGKGSERHKTTVQVMPYMEPAKLNALYSN